MRYYVLFTSLLLAALAATPTQAAVTHDQRLPFKASHVEKLTSAKYVGLGLVDKDTNVAIHKRSLEALPNQCTQRYGCLNCTWVRICAPTSDDTLVEVSRSPCPKDRPYCDYKTGACVADSIAPDCMIPSNLTCFKKEGYFPHPSDCKKFFYCSNYTSYLFECAGTYSYNIYSQRCDNYNCYTINCAGNEARKVQHPSSNAFFTYCSDGTPIGMDRCLGNDVLNATSQLCEPNCSNEGLIRDIFNCTKYYKCTYEWVNNNRFLMRKPSQCEDGHSFKPEEYQCVPGIPETGCIQTY